MTATPAELARVRELLKRWDSLGAGSLAPSARRREDIAYRRDTYDARLVARDLRREHYQTDDGWVTEPLSNEGKL